MLKKVTLLCSMLLTIGMLWAQSSRQQLTVPYIMRDPSWMGNTPSGVFWSDDSKTMYFRWNPDNEDEASLYALSVLRPGSKPQRIDKASARNIVDGGVYNKNRSRKLYLRDGDIFLYDIATGTHTQLTNTLERESNPRWTADESRVVFQSQNNLYSLHLRNGNLVQLSNFRSGNPTPEAKKSEQDQWLANDQYRWIEVLRQRKERSDRNVAEMKENTPKRPLIIYTQDKSVGQMQLSPDEQFITYTLVRSPQGNKVAQVPNYVTGSGYTENIPTRPKVGSDLASYEFGIYHIANDTSYTLSFDKLPGIDERPLFEKEYAQEGQSTRKTKRGVIPSGLLWNDNGTKALMVVRGDDNKDRWIVLVEPATASIQVIDHQHDEAWIGGPGVESWAGSTGTLGWIDNQTLYFQSEATGYSNLYAYNLAQAQKRTIVGGNFEVRSVKLSNDKKFFYVTTSEIHPGEDHFYKVPVTVGTAQKLTTMTGGNECYLSPDEKFIAIRHSYSNKPYELYLQENKPGARPVQLTESLSEEFKAYPWRAPEVITFPAQDGAQVYARLYQPEASVKNGAAVIFVHGAGYLQNAHKRWSTYFREYMFHNLLTDMGYTVLDIDYRGSAGYGRNWRTGIYRHMGGKDLSDHVDGARFLAEKYQIDPKRVGIYGGSYGGFITLMAMFTEPDVFAAGAALRSVTDWAHYNHGYTSNILNTPVADSLAYARSSPLYYAEGLKGALLICHGVIDTNVHFQDVVRLAQRLIELGKENWEFAVYPVEDHGFVEPSSWTDEYRRILKLFNDNIAKPK